MQTDWHTARSITARQICRGAHAWVDLIIKCALCASILARAIMKLSEKSGGDEGQESQIVSLRGVRWYKIARD